MRKYSVPLAKALGEKKYLNTKNIRLNNKNYKMLLKRFICELTITFTKYVLISY